MDTNFLTHALNNILQETESKAVRFLRGRAVNMDNEGEINNYLAEYNERINTHIGNFDIWCDRFRKREELIDKLKAGKVKINKLVEFDAQSDLMFTMKDLKGAEK